MSRIGFVGIRATARPGSKENTGNFLHGYAARQIVKEYADIGRIPTSDAEVATIREKFSHIGVVAATSVPLNRIHRAADQQLAIAKLVERAGLPVVVFGLGVQARYNAKVSEANVAPNTVQFL